MLANYRNLKYSLSVIWGRQQDCGPKCSEEPSKQIVPTGERKQNKCRFNESIRCFSTLIFTFTFNFHWMCYIMLVSTVCNACVVQYVIFSHSVSHNFQELNVCVGKFYWKKGRGAYFMSLANSSRACFFLHAKTIANLF